MRVASVMTAGGRPRILAPSRMFSGAESDCAAVRRRVESAALGAEPTRSGLCSLPMPRNASDWNPIRPMWRTHAAPWLIVLSLSLNVTALTLPFLEVRRGLSTDEYGLLRSVQMLWESGLHVLAAVVALFSVVFPFVKLGSMIGIVTGIVPDERRHGLLAFVERFGKWSMLDVFLVALMISLANDQLMVGAQARHGILCFTAAIVVSMACSDRMSRQMNPRTPPAPTPTRPPLMLVLGQVALLVLLGITLCVPFLEIDDWLLSDRPLSIVTAVAGLWATGAHTLAVVVATFLALAPVAAGVLTLVLLLRVHRARAPARWRRALKSLRRWEMLDVFALALGIFLVEGREFVRTELAWGAFSIALLLVLYWPASVIQDRRLGA